MVCNQVRFNPYEMESSLDTQLLARFFNPISFRFRLVAVELYMFFLRFLLLLLHLVVVVVVIVIITIWIWNIDVKSPTLLLRRDL